MSEREREMQRIEEKERLINWEGDGWGGGVGGLHTTSYLGGTCFIARVWGEFSMCERQFCPCRSRDWDL